MYNRIMNKFLLLIFQTRMQVLVPHPRANYRNVPDALARIVRYEGIRNTLRGLNAVVAGAGPAHAMYFACYEKVKKTLSHSGSGNHLVHGNGGMSFLMSLIHN